MQQLGNYELFIALIISFIAGVLTSINPCMIGMASSVIAFQKDSKQRIPFPIILTLMLSFSISVTILGIIGSFFGDQMIHWNEQYHSTFEKLLAVLFVLIGSYVIGLRIGHIQQWLPFTIVPFYSRRAKQNDRVHSYPILKTCSLGTLFGVAPNPCTTPMMLAMISYTAVTGSVVAGGLILFAYAVGHSFLFFYHWVDDRNSKKSELVGSVAKQTPQRVGSYLDSHWGVFLFTLTFYTLVGLLKVSKWYFLL